MDYVPMTDQDQAAMLARIGVRDVEELFSDVPEAVRLRRPLELPPGLSETELWAHMRALAARNADLESHPSFLGAGAYDHLVPAVVRFVTSLPEFYTAYTPYQPEVSQGTLQGVFEFQTLICQLTGMDVANASMYDGASAAAEGALMAVAVTQRQRVVVSGAVHPHYRQVLGTYLANRDVAVDPVPWQMGRTDLEALEARTGPDTAAVVVQHPNFFGCLEELAAAAELAHRAGALLVAVVDPVALGVLASPGECGADVAVGEGQGLGSAIGFGGPYVGFFATRREFIRRMPGRLVGLGQDGEGRRAFTLVLQTREQHIRRERATSNICTNQGLNALAAAAHLAALGRQGLRRAGELCLQKSHYLHRCLRQLPGVRPAWETPFFKEFVVELEGEPEAAMRRLWREFGILGGLPLGRFEPRLARHVLWCVTEARTRQEMDRLVAAMAEMATAGPGGGEGRG